MHQGRLLEKDEDIRNALKNYKIVAVLGMSPKAEKTSNMVGRYLMDAGYKVIPIYPGAGEIEGLKAYDKLEDLEPGSVEILDVFRKSEDIDGHVEAAIRLKPKLFWMQLHIRNDAAAKRLMDAGIDVIMDKCIKVEHGKFCKV